MMAENETNTETQTTEERSIAETPRRPPEGDTQARAARRALAGVGVTVAVVGGGGQGAAIVRTGRLGLAAATVATIAARTKTTASSESRPYQPRFEDVRAARASASRRCSWWVDGSGRVGFGHGQGPARCPKPSPRRPLGQEEDDPRSAEGGPHPPSRRQGPLGAGKVTVRSAAGRYRHHRRWPDAAVFESLAWPTWSLIVGPATPTHAPRHLRRAAQDRRRRSRWRSVAGKKVATSLRWRAPRGPRLSRRRGALVGEKNRWQKSDQADRFSDPSSRGPEEDSDRPGSRQDAPCGRA